MFKHITYKLLFLFPIIIPTVFINYLIDPFGIFEDSKNEKDIAHHLNIGFSVSNIDYYDDRVIQKHLIFNKPNRDQLIILGSSKTMTLNKDIFPDFSFFNYSVVGATLEDVIAIYEMLIKSNKEPDLLILGVDPWFFNTNNARDKSWESIGSYYCNFLNRLKGSKDIPNNYSCMINPKLLHNLKKYTHLLSLEYFQISLQTIMGYSDRKNQFKVFKVSKSVDSNETAMTKLPDGSFSYGLKTRKRTTEETNNYVINTWLKNIPELNNFYTINQKRWDIFTSFIFFLKNRGINVIILLPPYHPIAYSFFFNNINYKSIVDVENRVISWSKENNIPTIWSYDPTICNYNDSDFYDATHVKREYVENYFKEVLDSTNYFNF